MRKKEKNYAWGILAFIFIGSLLVYWVTSARSVFWWDSGELIASVSTLGIAHRPSFPIYILLAKMFSFLPLGILIFKVNLFSGLLASFSLVTLFLIFIQLRNKKLKKRNIDLAIYTYLMKFRWRKLILIKRTIQILSTSFHI